MAGLKHSLSLPVTTKDKKPRRVPAKVRRMVALILDGPASRPLSKRAGLSRTYASVAVR
jgi:hypothetical protein